MLDEDPVNRPTLCEIKAHPWFNGETASMDSIREGFVKRQAEVEK